MVLQNNNLTFEVHNTVDSDYTPLVNGSGGIGLKNVQRLLDLLYPNHHQLSIGRENGLFKADLQVDLTEI